MHTHVCAWDRSRILISSVGHGGAGWSSGGYAKTTSQVLVDCRPGRFSVVAPDRILQDAQWVSGLAPVPKTEWTPPACRLGRASLGTVSARRRRLHGKGSAPHLALSFSPFSQITMHAKLCYERRSAVMATFALEGECHAHEG